MLEYSNVQLVQMVKEMGQGEDVTLAMITQWHVELLNILIMYGPQSNLFQCDDGILLKGCIQSILILQFIG